MNFKVDYLLEKDIWSYLHTCWKFTYPTYGRKTIQEKLLSPYPEKFKSGLGQAKTEKQARKVIADFLNSLSPNYQNTTLVIAKGVESILNKEKTNIISQLEKLYDKPFPFTEIGVYLTTIGINPYNYKEKWFMTGRNSSIEGHLKTARHELNHFMFYYYFPELKNKLGVEKYEILKEALAIFTNPEGNDKPAVKKLESFLKKQKGTIPEIITKVLLPSRGTFWNA